MFETFRNAWKIEDLRKRLMYTLLILVLFRVGCAITVPYINPAVLSTFFSGTEMLGYLNMMSGGALSQCAVFALGVSPYINASIIIQLLTVAIPALENLAKEGEEGRRKITRITHYTAMGIAFVMSIGYYFILRRMGALHYTSGWENWFSAVVIILTFTAGSQLITWMGEQIDSKGIGNGVSLLIFTEQPVHDRSRYADHGCFRQASVLCVPASAGGSGSGCGDLRGRSDQRRAPHPRPVRQAGGGPQDVRRSGQLHSH